VKNGLDILINDGFKVQPFAFLEPVTQPMAHGDDQKSYDIRIDLFSQVANFFQLIFDKPKHRLLSLGEFLFSFAGQLVSFPQNDQPFIFHRY